MNDVILKRQYNIKKTICSYHTNPRSFCRMKKQFICHQTTNSCSYYHFQLDNRKTFTVLRYKSCASQFFFSLWTLGQRPLSFSYQLPLHQLQLLQCIFESLVSQNFMLQSLQHITLNKDRCTFSPNLETDIHIPTNFIAWVNAW